MPGLEFYFQAFQELITERDIGTIIGPKRDIGTIIGPIPQSAIINWANYNQLDFGETKKLSKYIRAMESAQRDLEAVQRNKEKSRK